MPIEVNTPQGLRAKQTIDMLNSDWPIGTVGVATMAAADQVNGVTSAMGNLWLDRPITVTYDDLIRRPMIDRDITLTCVSESVGGNYVGNARWQGTLLAPILRKAGVHRGADQIVMRDVHGMTIGVALSLIHI